MPTVEESAFCDEDDEPLAGRRDTVAPCCEEDDDEPLAGRRDTVAPCCEEDDDKPLEGRRDTVAPCCEVVDDEPLEGRRDVCSCELPLRPPRCASIDGTQQHAIRPIHPIVNKIFRILNMFFII